MRIIGLDCATDDSRIGVALGEYEAGGVEVLGVDICSPERSAVSIVAKWLAGSSEALLAIDAPLGWPAPFARALNAHKAGDAIATKPNDMFRRETDRFIQREIGKTPLDVGADRIARTARAALGILGDLRTVTGAAVPLAWDPDSLTGIEAIEVYPAATLAAHGFRSSGYKNQQQVKERAAIVSELARVLALPADKSQITNNADVLDGVVCLLAAKDFLDGRAMRPVDADLAAREGWIWTPPRRPRTDAITHPGMPDRLQRIPARRAQGKQDGVIENVSGLTAREVAGRQVLCPAWSREGIQLMARRVGRPRRTQMLWRPRNESGSAEG